MPGNARQSTRVPVAGLPVASDTRARYAVPSSRRQTTATAWRGNTSPGCQASIAVLAGSHSSIDANRQPGPTVRSRRSTAATVRNSCADNGSSGWVGIVQASLKASGPGGGCP